VRKTSINIDTNEPLRIRDRSKMDDNNEKLIEQSVVGIFDRITVEIDMKLK